ncbi:MAG: prepilin-type N-terminal cleavage/methylation domain-containing protein [Myxococcales bacterium]|nr:prepilin-type N-terminal cleavage/methylation domain-containing protein [Myxococcales bacterium]
MVRARNRLRWVTRFPGASSRGFTLIELMVVVIIIGALAVLAIPTISGQMRSRRTQFVAKEVSNLYRMGRLRAMGRGSAVMVRYSRAVDTEGRFNVLEAIRINPNNAACDRLPVSSCTVTDWASATQTQPLGGLVIKDRPELEGVRARGRDPNNADVATMDVCFTPMGRAFVRYAAAGQFTPLTAVPRLMVTRVDGGNVPVGPARWVLVLPNGSARLGTATVEATL